MADGLMSLIAQGGTFAPVSSYYQGVADRQAAQLAQQQNALQEMAMIAKNKEMLWKAEQQKAEFLDRQRKAQEAERLRQGQISYWEKYGNNNISGQELANAGLLDNYLAELIKPKPAPEIKRYEVGGYLVDPYGNVVFKPPETGKPRADIPKVMDLRKEYQGRPVIKTLPDAERSLNDLRSLSESGSPADQVSIVYKFMKLNDPTSTVSTTEQGLLTGATGPLQALQSIWNKAMGEGGITPKFRDQIVRTAEILYENQYNQALKEQNRYSALSSRYGIDPWEVVGNPYEKVANQSSKKTTSIDIKPNGNYIYDQATDSFIEVK